MPVDFILLIEMEQQITTDKLNAKNILSRVAAC